MVGKTDDSGVADDVDVNCSSGSNASESRSQDCFNHKLLSRKTRLV